MIRSGKILLFTIIAACQVIISCGDDSRESEPGEFGDVLEFTPNQILAIDHTDSVYFSHLGYTSVVLNNGDIVIPDRGVPAIVVIDEEGNHKKVITEGRGPGEILDAYEFIQSEDGFVFVYDQDNEKILVFSENMNLNKEIIPRPFEGTGISRVYPMVESGFLFDLFSFQFLENKDKDHEKILVQYNSEEEKYGREKVFRDKPYARLFTDGKLRGARVVPFSTGLLSAFNAKNNTLLVFDTRTDNITEIDFNFDTLKTIPVRLPVEKLNATERDSIEEKESAEQWRTLEPLLPETKAVADKMMLQRDRIWLKSNLRGNYEKWFVLNMQGQIIKAVNLPKESMLTHVSDEHLGVRLDDVTFALYENPEIESP